MLRQEILTDLSFHDRKYYYCVIYDVKEKSHNTFWMKNCFTKQLFN